MTSEFSVLPHGVTRYTHASIPCGPKTLIKESDAESFDRPRTDDWAKKAIRDYGTSCISVSLIRIMKLLLTVTNMEPCCTFELSNDREEKECTRQRTPIDLWFFKPMLKVEKCGEVKGTDHVFMKARIRPSGSPYRVTSNTYTACDMKMDSSPWVSIHFFG